MPFVVKAAKVTLRDARGHDAGTLELSIQDIIGFVRYMHRRYPVDIVVRGKGIAHARRSLAAADPASLPDRGTTTIAGRRYVVRSFHATAFPHERLKVWVLAHA